MGNRYRQLATDDRNRIQCGLNTGLSRRGAETVEGLGNPTE
jgi:hypothetical protein